MASLYYNTGNGKKKARNKLFLYEIINLRDLIIYGSLFQKNDLQKEV